MTRLLRLTLLAAALALPGFATSTPAQAAGAPFEEIAAARDGQQARAARQPRRHHATRGQTRQRHAQRTRRARTAQQG